MTNIATDHPLSETQQKTLAALLDAMLPESEDGNMPSARELDLIGYLNEKADAFIPVVVQVVQNFDDTFARLSLEERYALLEAFSLEQAELFEGLLFHVYTCYYQNQQVLEGIGMAAGPPFPGGNTLEMGDLSLLDTVVQKSRGYRK